MEDITDIFTLLLLTIYAYRAGEKHFPVIYGFFAIFETITFIVKTFL